jgi:hypothetical protein
MLQEYDRHYHMTRACSELDSAAQAQLQEVAEAHRRLAALHMDRLRALDESCGGSAPIPAAGQSLARIDFNVWVASLSKR